MPKKGIIILRNYLGPPLLSDGADSLIFFGSENYGHVLIFTGKYGIVGLCPLTDAANDES